MLVPPVRICFPPEDRQRILVEIDEALASGQLTLGKHTRAFEEEFAAQAGVKHAVAVSSGTAALEIALRALGVAGKEVLVPTNTFFATPAAVLHAGGRARFVDADASTFSVSLATISAAMTRETAGVIVVHIAGIVTPEMPRIAAFCRERGLFLVEDAAHAHGCSFDGRSAGSFGDAGAFSFYPTKVITTAEGGMIVTDRDDMAAEARIYRDQGKASFERNAHTHLGYNWRMSEIHACLGRHQLRRLAEFIEARNAIARLYDAGLEGIPGIVAVPIPNGCRSNLYKYLALLDAGVDRSALKRRLRAEHEVILSGEVYEAPCHEQPVFRDVPRAAAPVAEDLCRRHVCLPVFPGQTTAQVEHVLASLEKVLSSL